MCAGSWHLASSTGHKKSKKGRHSLSFENMHTNSHEHVHSPTQCLRSDLGHREQVFWYSIAFWTFAPDSKRKLLCFACFIPFTILYTITAYDLSKCLVLLGLDKRAPHNVFVRNWLYNVCNTLQMLFFNIRFLVSSSMEPESNLVSGPDLICQNDFLIFLGFCFVFVLFLLLLFLFSQNLRLFCIEPFWSP